MTATVLSTIDYSYDLSERAAGIVQTAAGLAPAVTLDQQFDEAGNRTVLSATIGTTADFSNDFFCGSRSCRYAAWWRMRDAGRT